MVDGFASTTFSLIASIGFFQLNEFLHDLKLTKKTSESLFSHCFDLSLI